MTQESSDLFHIFESDPHFREIMRRLLENSMEHSFNGVVITKPSPGYPIVYVNDAFCEMTGYGPHEIMGKSPAMLQGADTDQEVLGRLSRDIRNGDLFHGRAVNYRKDGSQFIMEWKIIPIKDDQDKISHYLAIQKDVSTDLEQVDA